MATEYKGYKERYETFNYINWRCAFAGAIVAIILDLTLNLLGLGIGLSSGVGAGVWMGIMGIISLFVGGWYASRSAGFNMPVQGMFQGVLTWALVCFSIFFVIAGTAAARVTTLLGRPVDFETLSTAAFWSFIGLVLGVIAAAIGGRYGISRGGPAGVVAYPEEREKKAA